MSNPYYVVPTPVYAPQMCVMQAITNARPASITTTTNHNYITGTIVRVDVPNGFGMTQINQEIGTIVVTGSTTFTISIDTTQYDPLLLYASWPTRSAEYPLVVPIGEDNSILTAAVQNVL